MNIFSCFIVKQFPTGHRVVWVKTENELITKLSDTEEELYYVHFPEDQFDGKITEIVQYLGLEDTGFFFSELIYIGFIEGRKQYNKFLTQTKFNLEFRFQSQNPHFDEIYQSLHMILSNEEIWDISIQTVLYGMQSLFELPQEDVLGICLN